ALVWIAAHESRPDGRLPRQMVYSAAAAAVLVVVSITLLTFSKSPASEPLLPVPPRVNEMLRVKPWIMGFGCGIGITVAEPILVLFFSWVFRNSLATRPTVAGALYGAGAGLAINAGWRIACPISTPWHSLGAHGAAIIATVILGALIGRYLGNRRLHIGGRRFSAPVGSSATRRELDPTSRTSLRVARVNRPGISPKGRPVARKSSS